MIPVGSVKQGLQEAYIEIESPDVAPGEKIIPFRFNPTEYQLQKANTFAEIAIPGLESPPLQFVRGAAEKLSVELLADTSDTLEDVRVRFVTPMRELLRIKEELHAPPIVNFVWDAQVFHGVLESLNVSYILFTPRGIPLRAKLSVALKEYRPVKIQLAERSPKSPDFDKSYTSRRGETLSSIAGAVYRDAGVWREIARNNGIQDPRALPPGSKLAIPRLR